jgi:hypothetical protein
VTIGRPVEVAFGLVHLSQQATIGRRSGLTAEVALADGVTVRGVELPCDALELGDRPPPAPPAISATEDALVSRGARLTLAAAPDDAEHTVTVHIRRPNEVRMTETDRRDDWVRVWHSFRSGASFQGWTRASAVRAAGQPPRVRAREVRQTRERVHQGCERVEAGFFRGVARVTRGSSVHESPDGPVWAQTVATSLVIRTVDNPDWVVVERVDGLRVRGRCPENLEDAWLPRAAVTFRAPSEVPGAVPE